jgi:LmbE family N-acetylglucosaminyl deacetylase
VRELSLRPQPGARFHLLCLGAHADDIEIGCGGLVLTLLKTHRRIDVHWIVFSADARRSREARQGARAFLGTGGTSGVAVHRFRDGFFPYQGAAIKKAFETVKRSVPSPDLVLTHYRDDRHQDHRVISDLTWNTFRDHVVLEYEIPKYDGDLGTPNCFVPLDRETSERKVKGIEAAFPSQRHKSWFDADTFLGLMRLRGVECRAGEGYAEAFYARKVVLGVGSA